MISCQLCAGLSELNDGEKFYYSNTTQTRPKDISQLRAIAGCGKSPVVNYEGTGVYWLDRLEEGVWRLEVMPMPYRLVIRLQSLLWIKK